MVRANALFSSFRIPFASPRIYRSRNKIAIIVYVVLACIILDTFVNQNAQVRDFISISSNWSIAFFIILAAVTIMGQYYILKYVRHKTREFRRKVRTLNISFKVTAVIQCLLVAVFLFVIAEIVINSHYPSASLAVVTAVSYGLNIFLMAVFAEIFFSWYKSNRSSIAVLLYGLSFAVVVITSCVFLTGSLNRFIEKPVYISPFSNIELTKSEPGSIQNLLAKIYHYSDIVSFALKWIATVFLLYHYSQKMGRAKYWTLISLPLLYFLGTYLDDFHIYEPKNELEEFYWQIYVTLNSTAGGILFYIGFIVAAKHFQDDWAIKDYLLICGFGFLLFFNAGQSTLANSLYPPYGLATMSFYGLSSFLIILGLYSSAVSISQDSGLRRLIVKLATNEMNLLRSIGTAHREAEIWKRVNKLKSVVDEEEREMEQRTGVQSSLEDKDVKSYVEEVLQEFGKTKIQK
jgi:uncharacterized integral membrane protein